MNLDVLGNFAGFEAFARRLPNRTGYTRDELLLESQRLYRDKTLEIYYAPTDYINPAARIILLGITPGWQQMEQFYRSARTGIINGKNREECLKTAKEQSSFYGSMRTNLITMLDALELPKLMGIKNSASLFNENRHLIHTSSIIRYPVFVRGKNYTGHTPSPQRHDAMHQIIHELLLPELLQISNALIIPLGNAVTDVLDYLIDDNLLPDERCCRGFPHPSGANGHRHRQFIQNHKLLCNQIKDSLGC